MTLKSVFVAGVLALASTGASAATLTLDGKAQYFDNVDSAGVVSEAWDRTFEFTIAAGTTAFLTVFDYWAAGEQFEVTVNGSSIGLTSTPGSSPVTLTKANFATGQATAIDANSAWSSATIELTAGLYDVTGSVVDGAAKAGGFALLTSSATNASAFTTAVVRPSARALVAAPSSVPLPAAGWMLLAGLGGIAALRRKS